MSGSMTLEKPARQTKVSADNRRNETIIIRRYRPEDHAELLAIWAETGQKAYSQEEISRLRRIEGDGLVAEVTNANGISEVAGVVLWSHNGQKAFLWRLAVAPAHRQKGIATRLLDRVERDILAAGFREIAFHVHERNTAAQRMYLKRGYQHMAPVGYWGKKFEAPETHCTGNKSPF